MGGDLQIRSATHVIPDLFLGHSQGIGFETDFFIGRCRMKGGETKKKGEKNGIGWHEFKIREESNFVESIAERYVQIRRSRMVNRYVPMLEDEPSREKTDFFRLGSGDCLDFVFGRGGGPSSGKRGRSGS